MIPLEVVAPGGRCETPYRDRYEMLRVLLEQCDSSIVRMVETRVVHSRQEAVDHFVEKVREGLEGTVVKKADGVWFDGTSKDQVKLKMKAQCELRVKDFLPGEGKNAETFGSLLCVSECGAVEVAVHGFPDSLRKEIHENRETWINSIITAEFNDILYPSADKKSTKHSLFLPIFQDQRLDKTVADDLASIERQFKEAIDALALTLAA